MLNCVECGENFEQDINYNWKNPDVCSDCN
jgi:DNA-directed RNA polymerase subunit RPC12/RpoP